MPGSCHPVRSPVTCSQCWNRCSMSRPMPRKYSGRVIVTLLSVVILLGIALAGGYLWVKSAYYSPGPAKDIVRIEVQQGESVRTVLMNLTKQGALSQPRAVEMYLRIERHLKG